MPEAPPSPVLLDAEPRELEQLFRDARAALIDDCARGHITMSIPANPRRDTDLLVMRACEEGIRLLSEVRALREDQKQESSHGTGCPNWRVDLMLDRLPDGAVIERRESGYAVTLPGRPMCVAPTLRRALVAFDLDQPPSPAGER